MQIHVSPFSASTPALRVVLVDNPNCEKTVLFNLLMGSHRKVANYAGVTVERKGGRFAAPSGRHVQILDLPSVYDLVVTSPDEAITCNICLGTFRGEPRPDLLICVVDATSLWLHLYFVLELQCLDLPMVLALNMVDVAERRGIRIDRAELEATPGVLAVQAAAIKRNDAADLVAHTDHEQLPAVPVGLPVDADPHVEVKRLLDTAVTMPRSTTELDNQLDCIVLHLVLGLMLLAVLMLFMFQAMLSWAQPLMGGT